MADTSVRLATPSDAAGVTRVQAAAWRAAYAEVLPPDLLAELDSAAVTRQWLEAIVAPPTPRHRLIVALDAAEVVGFAAFGPSADPDLRSAGPDRASADPDLPSAGPDLAGGVDAELFALCVDPARARAGHGSRLLNAAVDHLREDRFRQVYGWLPDLPRQGNDRLRAFLDGAGWGDSGARRVLDLAGDGGLVVDQVRLHTSIDQSAIEQPSTEQPSTEQPSVEQPSTEQPSTVQPSTEPGA